jgi:pimeloyl-ACP methyl ester carboxylesterase
MLTTAAGLRVACAATGPGSGPAVVLLPGPTDSWRSYRPVLELLPPTIRTIAVSPRGHGASDKPATGYRVHDFAGDVVPILDELDVERAVLVGHSASCLVVRRVALDRPERVAGLVLEASPLRLGGDERLEQFVTSVVAGLDDPIDPTFVRSFVADTSTESLPDDVVDELVAETLLVPAHVWKETFAGVLEYDDVDELATLTAPCLLVWGDADALVPRAAQDDLAARLPHAELRIYEGVGHTPRWERPQRFADDVAAFASASFVRG